MRTITKLFSHFLVLTLGLSMLSCDEIAECVLGINPEIHSRRLEMGFVNEPYYDIITAEVRNQVFDNDYIYNFDVFGEVPPGIFLDFDRRAIELRGTPEEPGSYTFTVELFVEYFDENGLDGSPTCNEFAEREFTIRVIE